MCNFEQPLGMETPGWILLGCHLNRNSVTLDVWKFTKNTLTIISNKDISTSKCKKTWKRSNENCITPFKNNKIAKSRCIGWHYIDLQYCSEK